MKKKMFSFIEFFLAFFTPNIFQMPALDFDSNFKLVSIFKLFTIITDR